MIDYTLAIVVVIALFGLAVRHIWMHRPAYEEDRTAALLARWRREIKDRPDLGPPLRQPDPYLEIADDTARRFERAYPTPEPRPWPDSELDPLPPART